MRLLALVLLLTACGARHAPMPPASLTPYQAGMREGCSSGYVAAGHPYHRFSKDVQRYLADAEYKTGWDDGMLKCKGEYEAIGRAMR